MNQDAQANPMGTRKVYPLLITMSLPPMISMLIQSMYNVVDSIFVAKLGEDALTAVSLAFPMQNLVLALAVGLGVGMNASIARNLGAGKKADANSSASHGMLLAGLHSLLFVILGIVFYQAVYPDVYHRQPGNSVGNGVLPYCYLPCLWKHFPHFNRKNLPGSRKYGSSNGSSGSRSHH